MNTEELEQLRDALVTAPKGTSDLDKRVAKVFGLKPGRYTRSLDAQLPMENIIEMRQGQDSEGKPLFLAVHCRESDGVGVHYGSMGRTEVIARRCAVLMDHIAEGQAAT